MMLPSSPRAIVSAIGRNSSAPSLAWSAGLALSLLIAPAAAEESSAENKAAARDLATEGIKLAQDGNCQEAIPKLNRAEKLYHAPTILTWIGQCQIELGHYVEGTETLNRVVRENLSEDAPDAFKAAQTTARDLITKARPKIGKLTIVVTPADVEGLEVRVDDRAIASALVGVAKPTDPGNHTVTVSAPGFVTVTREIELGEGGQESLSVALEAEPAPAPGAAEPEPAGGDPTTPEEVNPAPNWIGWSAVGAGAALMAGGGVLGYLAVDKKSDLSCDDDRRCPSSEEDTLSAARKNATVSTVLFGVGGAVAVTGVVLLITGKSTKTETTTGRSVQPTVGLGRLGLRGAF